MNLLNDDFSVYSVYSIHTLPLLYEQLNELVSFVLCHQISCTLKIKMAPLLLGYEWSSNVSHHGNSKEEASYLSVFITLDPPITSKEEPSVTVSIMLFYFQFMF